MSKCAAKTKKNDNGGGGATKGKIRKSEDEPTSAGRIHKQVGHPDDLLRFSFRHFGVTEKYGYPTENEGAYLRTLLERVRNLSGLTIKEFRTNKSKSLRIHTHEWAKTSEPDGYAHLGEQLQQCEPWQFGLSVNEHGRVHGLLIDEVFYVIWLDVGHKMYS